MVTINPYLEALTKEDVLRISEEYLRGFIHLNEKYHFVLRGLNSKRRKFGLPPLSKDIMIKKRTEYIRNHYSDKEIENTIYNYLLTHRMDKARYEGIYMFNCAFYARDYAKGLVSLLGKRRYNELAEKARLAKIRETQTDIYGGLGLQSKTTYDKAWNTKQKRMRKDMNQYVKTNDISWFLSGSSSTQERLVAKALVKRYGIDDVIYQYASDVYPTPCDFYINSEDLYIELNYHYAHRDAWFNPDSKADQMFLANCKTKNTKSSHEIVQSWAVSDVEKRSYAKKAHLNYLVFWDGVMRDFTLNPDMSQLSDLSDFYDWYCNYSGNTKQFIQDHPQNTY